MDVRAALVDGDMPPDGEESLSAEDRGRVIDWLTAEAEAASQARQGAREHSTFRRLARYEYDFALRDLLGVARSFGEELPPDPISEDGFENSAEVLQLDDAVRGLPRRSARRAGSRDGHGRAAGTAPLERVDGRGSRTGVAPPGQRSRGHRQEARRGSGEARGGAREAPPEPHEAAGRDALRAALDRPLRAGDLGIQRSDARLRARGGRASSSRRVRRRRRAAGRRGADHRARGSSPRGGGHAGPGPCRARRGRRRAHPEPAPDVRLAGEQRLQRRLPRGGGGRADRGGPRGARHLRVARPDGHDRRAQPRTGREQDGRSSEPVRVHQARQLVDVGARGAPAPRRGDRALHRELAARVPSKGVRGGSGPGS